MYHLLAYADINGPVNTPQTTYALTVASSPIFNAGGWFGFSSFTSGYLNTVAYPLWANGQITLESSATPNASRNSVAGVAQMVNGLTVGNIYRLTIDHTGYTTLPGIFVIGGTGNGSEDFIGNQGTPTPYAMSPNSSGISFQDFIATASSMPLVIAYIDNVNRTFVVNSISLQEAPTSAPISYVDLNDGQVICDLYQEQDIPLTLSIDDFKNVAEKQQSYSKDFDLPATKRNNRIFTHIFEITKSINSAFDFNPYARTKAVLKTDGLVVFEGSLRLIEIKNQKGEISYNVNLYSEAVALKQILETKTFADIDLSELDHNYNINNIQNSVEGQLELLNNLASDSFALEPTLATNETNVLKYPFCDWTGNINCINDKPELNALEDAFRPWIRIKYLIQNIFRNAGYEYTSTFIDSADFKKLYMDFNWGKENGPNDFTHTGSANYRDGDADYFAGTTSTIGSGTVWQFLHEPTDTFDSDTGWDLSSSKFTCQQDNTFYSLEFQLIGYWVNTSAKWKARVIRKNNSGVLGAVGSTTVLATSPLYSSTSTQELWYQPSITDVPLHKNGTGSDELYVEWYSDTASACKQRNYVGGQASWVRGTVYNNAEIVESTMLQANRGEQNQWEFLKGIMTMFNLITIPDPKNPNNIIIETYDDIFGLSTSSGTTLASRNIEYDWTDKVDLEKMTIKPMDLKRMVHFRYEEDEDDYPFSVYKLATGGKLYGEKKLDTTSLTLMSGQISNLAESEEIIATPFASTIIKPIHDNFPQFYIPVIYGSENGWEFEGIDNLPRILYDNYKLEGSVYEYDVPGQNGVAGGVKDKYLLFSHTSDTPAANTDYDYNFGWNSMIGITNSTVLNLYNLYHAPYYNELYNIDTKVITAQVYLTASDINTFDFRKQVMIKNRAYRVNKIEYKPNSLSNVEFILIP